MVGSKDRDGDRDRNREYEYFSAVSFHKGTGPNTRTPSRGSKVNLIITQRLYLQTPSKYHHTGGRASAEEFLEGYNLLHDTF